MDFVHAVMTWKWQMRKSRDVVRILWDVPLQWYESAMLLFYESLLQASVISIYEHCQVPITQELH